MGGNNMLGVLGQMGGILELAEQIEAGEVPDIDVLYLPVGSTCTLSGHVLGICLAKHIGMKAFESPGFKIVAVPIHPGIGAAQRNFGIFHSRLSSFLPLFPRFAFSRVSKYLKREGLDVDLEPLAIAFLKDHVELVTDHELIGEYGTHSLPSLAAATLDTTMQVQGKQPEWMASLHDDQRRKAIIPWLCGHFAAKPFARLVDDLQREGEKPAKPLVRLFWQTKSWIQPHGSADEWTHLNQLAKEKPVKDLVLVTGASRGFGRALALAFTEELSAANEGDLYLHLWSRDTAGLAATTEAIQATWKSQDQALHVTQTAVDLSDQRAYCDTINNFLSDIAKLSLKRIVIVHNAGSLGEVGRIANVSSPQAIQKHMELNVNSVLWFNKRFLEAYGQASSGGNVVKFGASARDMHFRVVAIEEPNVKTLNYAPGPMETEMNNA
ncbi:unnamed protein product, partial [Aphanomyces euteiches]